MKKTSSKGNSKSIMLCLAGVVTAAAVIKNKTKNKCKLEKDKNTFDLVQATKELGNNSNDNDKIKKYIEKIDNMDLNISNLWIIKEGYDLILQDDNVDESLKNDFKLILEMKGVNLGYKG